MLNSEAAFKWLKLQLVALRRGTMKYCARLDTSTLYASFAVERFI